MVREGVSLSPEYFAFCRCCFDYVSRGAKALWLSGEQLCHGSSLLMARRRFSNSGVFWRAAPSGGAFHPVGGVHSVRGNGGRLLHGAFSTGILAHSQPRRTGRRLLFCVLIFGRGGRGALERGSFPGESFDEPAALHGLNHAGGTSPVSLFTLFAQACPRNPVDAPVLSTNKSAFAVASARQVLGRERLCQGEQRKDARVRGRKE
jgi:hypothetical protein